MIVCNYDESNYLWYMKQDKVYQIRLSETLLDKAHKAAGKKKTKLSKAVKEFINEFIKEK